MKYLRWPLGVVVNSEHTKFPMTVVLANVCYPHSVKGAERTQSELVEDVISLMFYGSILFLRGSFLSVCPDDTTNTTNKHLI